jgi:hypothetical protein
MGGPSGGPRRRRSNGDRCGSAHRALGRRARADRGGGARGISQRVGLESRERRCASIGPRLVSGLAPHVRETLCLVVSRRSARGVGRVGRDAVCGVHGVPHRLQWGKAGCDRGRRLSRNRCAANFLDGRLCLRRLVLGRCGPSISTRIYRRDMLMASAVCRRIADVAVDGSLWTRVDAGRLGAGARRGRRPDCSQKFLSTKRLRLQACWHPLQPRRDSPGPSSRDLAQVSWLLWILSAAAR